MDTNKLLDIILQYHYANDPEVVSRWFVNCYDHIGKLWSITIEFKEQTEEISLGE